MEKNIYLYRHGETNWNILDRVMGQKADVSTYFTPNGYNQIKFISEELKKNHVEVIFCSDYQRTIDTSKIAGDDLNIPLYISKEVRGLNVGKYQGMYFDEYINQIDVKESFQNYNLPIGGGESVNQLNIRMKQFITNVCEKTKFKSIAIISHSAAISNLKSYITGDKYTSLQECDIVYKDGTLTIKNSIPNEPCNLKLYNDLIWVRHANNASNCYIENNLLPLSEMGIKQAYYASIFLKDSFDVVISSPSKRALSTAYIISNGEKRIIQDLRLIERGFGNQKQDGKETDFEAKERILEFLLDINRIYKGQRILIVSHGSLIKLVQDVIECHHKNRDSIENCTIVKYKKEKQKEIIKPF